jgi:hypothetical protein
MEETEEILKGFKNHLTTARDALKSIDAMFDIYRQTPDLIDEFNSMLEAFTKAETGHEINMGRRQ